MTSQTECAINFSTGFGTPAPDGSLVIKKLRTISPSPGAESKSEKRRLWEWQRGKIRSAISRYRGRKLLILASSGEETWEYSRNFRDTFRSAGWNVQGPKAVPPADEQIIDVQVSADNAVTPRPEVLAVMTGLKEAGIKRRETYILDPDISHNLIVLWVGAKSPDGVRPEDCLPVSFKQHKGEHEPCALVGQTLKPAPIPAP